VASTHTSLFLRNSGMEVACTGVMRAKPKESERTDKVVSDSRGMISSNRRAVVVIIVVPL
jgi:hypothetical protein